MNDHTHVDWSQFTSQATVQSFVSYLKSDVVQMYGLDGIDIKDGHSVGANQAGS